MAEKQGSDEVEAFLERHPKLDEEANVIDPVWRLDEETGRLGYDSFRTVRSNPRQLFLIANAKEDLPTELVERYWRIHMDRGYRGIGND